MPPAKRSHWDVPKGSAWEFVDPCNGNAIQVKVTRKFQTTDGWFVHLNTMDGVRWGNAPITELGERIKR